MEVDQNRTGLLSDRWRPYFFGSLVGIPIAVMMVQVWRHWDLVAVTWFTLYLFLGGLDVFWRTYTRKLVSTALMVGTVAGFLVR
jgi:hypothetical protein